MCIALLKYFSTESNFEYDSARFNAVAEYLLNHVRFRAKLPARILRDETIYCLLFTVYYSSLTTVDLLNSNSGFGYLFYK